MSSPTADATLPLLVPLPSDLARTIDTLAKQRGQDRAGFIVQFLQEQLAKPAVSFEERMAPIAEDFKRSGMTEEDLDTLVEDERQATWSEKRPAG
jgi:hypothetical protein